MKNALHILQLAVDELHRLELDAWEEFAALWDTVYFAKKEFISRPYSIENYLYFNLKGLQRLVHTDEAGKETTIELCYEHCFGGHLASVVLQKASCIGYQALTNSTVMRCSYSDLSSLMSKHAGIERLMRIILANTIDHYIDHLVVVKGLTAIGKYNAIQCNRMIAQQKVPQKYIANHLGLDATNFSKIKRQRYGRGK